MKKIKFIFPLLLLVFFLSACSIKFNAGGGQKTNVAEGGVYLSQNNGDTWKQFSLIPSADGQTESLSSKNILKISSDPSDSNSFYLATNSGLYYTYNLNEGWRFVSGLGKEIINDIAFSSQNKCTLYAALNNTVSKSTDCSRTWTQMYYDNSPEVLIQALTVDPTNDGVVYLGTSRGDLLQSLDGGQSWRAIDRFSESVRRILMDPKDNNSLFVATAEGGLSHFTVGSGRNDLSPMIKDLKLTGDFVDLVVAPKDSYIYFATTKGLAKSFDNGQSFMKISLVTPDEDSEIKALAVSPIDPKQIYYVTKTTFFRSLDGGETWSTKSLGMSLGGSALLVNSADQKTIYLGLARYKN